MEVDPYSEEIKENEPKSSSSEESSSLKTDDLDSEKYKDGTEERKKKKRKRKKYLKREPTEEELRKFVKIKVNYVAKNHIWYFIVKLKGFKAICQRYTSKYFTLMANGDRGFQSGLLGEIILNFHY